MNDPRLQKEIVNAHVNGIRKGKERRGFFGFGLVGEFGWNIETRVGE